MRRAKGYDKLKTYLASLEGEIKLTNGEIAKAVGLDARTVIRYLDRLEVSDFLERKYLKQKRILVIK